MSLSGLHRFACTSRNRAVLAALIVLTAPFAARSPGAEDSVEPAPPPPPVDNVGPAPERPRPQASAGRPSGRTLIFFPPLPPRLWAPLPTMDVSASRNAAPAELAAFVGEPYYAPLGTRIRDDSMTPAQRQKLDAHRQSSAVLRTELRQTLEAVRELDPISRERALAELAAAQAPRLAELEAQAEALRQELIRGRDGWGALREWRLGSTPFGTAAQAMSAQYQVLRAAAYYQRGLSPAQRRLLREIILDMENLVDMPLMGNELAADRNPLFGFSPETARIRLPSPLTAEVAELITTYEREKATLKQELRDTLYEEDRTLFGFLRTSRLEQLARSQEPRFAALELLAERIRKALAAARFRPQAPTLPSFPPAVVDRIDGYIEQQKQLQSDVLGVLTQIQTVADVEQVNVAPSANGRFEIRLSIRRGPRQAEQMERVKERLSDFNATHTQRLQELEQELASLRQTVAWLQGEGEGERAEKEAARALETYFTALENRERLDKYRDYETAVLEPGLSPAQRRLLFSAALTQLNLPLPAGVPQPTRPAGDVRPRMERPAMSPIATSDRGRSTMMGPSEGR